MNRWEPEPEVVADNDQVVPIQRGRDLRDRTEFAPIDMIRTDVAEFVQQYVSSNIHSRGPFQLREGGQNQVLPGLTVPPWLAMLVNQLCSDPRLPYNNDRPALLRDMLVLASMGIYNHLAADAQNDQGIRDAIHIIRHEETLRRELYVEQLLVQYTEDLTFAADLLTLKMQAGRREVVFKDLKRLFDHVASISDTEFWRPTILRALRRIPEVRTAVGWLGEDGSYRFDPEYMNWVDLMTEEED